MFLRLVYFNVRLIKNQLVTKVDGPVKSPETDGFVKGSDARRAKPKE